MIPILLIGVPGAGKSTVGRLLAEKLNTSFVDADDAIVAKVGKPISQVFTDDGEEFFRKIETETILEILQEADGVVSLGGGALGSLATREAIRNTTVVWLRVSLSAAVDRVGMNRNRPLLLGNVRGKLNELMSAREPVYQEAASIEVETSDKSIAEVVNEIASKLAEIR